MKFKRIFFTHFMRFSLGVTLFLSMSHCKPSSQTSPVAVEDTLAMSGDSIDPRSPEEVYGPDPRIAAMTTEEKVAAALADFAAIHAQSPAAWMKEAYAGCDTTLQGFKPLNYKLSAEDLQELSRAVRGRRIMAGDVRRIFHDASLFLADSALATDSISFDVVSSGGRSPLLAYHPHNDMSWEDPLFYVQGDQLLASQLIFHHYGLEVAGFQWSGIGPVIHHKSCLESGTGVWFYVECFYTVTDGKLVPVWYYMQEANSNMGGSARNFWMQTKVLSYNPLKIKYSWEVSLGRNNVLNAFFLDQSQVVSYATQPGSKVVANYGKGPLDAERMASLSLNAPHALFIHAWYDELVKALKGKNAKRRDMVVDFWVEEQEEEHWIENL